jgi:hypothetical protein
MPMLAPTASAEGLQPSRELHAVWDNAKLAIPVVNKFINVIRSQCNTSSRSDQCDPVDAKGSYENHETLDAVRQ